MNIVQDTEKAIKKQLEQAVLKVKLVVQESDTPH
jgi:hypothetical protein